ncbi:MAG: hypothetical protein QW667_03615 [Candidatus Bathyarchaeia archaeon]
MKFLEDIEEYMHSQELIMVILLTGFFIFLSFIGYTKMSTTEIIVRGQPHLIHIAYYGFPCQMIGILNPLTDMENYWIYQSGQGLIRIIWSGLLLNVILYFFLAFFIIYTIRRLKG